MAAGTFTGVMRIHTVISGTNDYLSGERDVWFAPAVGLIKLVYNHDDGSTTTAELAGGPYNHHIYLPTIMNNYTPSEPTFGEVIRTIPSPGDGAQGLAWDGANLWVVWDNIYKLDPANGAVLAQIPNPAGDIQGLTWDGSALWSVSYATDMIYQIDPGNGAILNSFATPDSRPIGIAWDGSALWHSDENGTPYRLNPVDGSVISSVPSPFGGNTTLLDWDGQYLWASMGQFAQVDTSTWKTIKTMQVPADFPKGIAWDGENVWNGGYQDNKIYLLNGTPAGATIDGRVLKNGAPIADREMYIVKNSNTGAEMQVGFVKTDASGQYSFTVDPEVEYELRGFGDINDNELGEWVQRVTPTSQNPDVTLNDVDCWYDGLLSPADGATFNRDQINASNPIAFSWSAKDGANDYAVWLRERGNWSNVLWTSNSSANTSVNFDGIGNDGTKIPAMQYDWHIGMGLDNGWWVWSDQRMLEVTDTAVSD